MSNLTVLFNEATSFILPHAVFLSANDSVIEKKIGEGFLHQTSMDSMIASCWICLGMDRGLV